MVNGELVWTDRVIYDPENPYLKDSKWQRHDENHYSHPITEEEFNRIVASYPRVSLDMYPISDYPLTDNSPSGIGNPPTVYENYDDLVSSRTAYIVDMALDVLTPEYQLTDLDGDGRQELIYKEGDWIGVFTMKDGQVKQLVSGRDVKLCDGNILAVTRPYLDGNKTYCYYKIENGNAVLVDYLCYDSDRDAADPWFCSPDNTGQDMTLKSISAREAQSVIDSYAPLDIHFTPVSEYPLH